MTKRKKETNMRRYNNLGFVVDDRHLPYTPTNTNTMVSPGLPEIKDIPLNTERSGTGFMATLMASNPEFFNNLKKQATTINEAEKLNEIENQVTQFEITGSKELVSSISQLVQEMRTQNEGLANQLQNALQMNQADNQQQAGFSGGNLLMFGIGALLLFGIFSKGKKEPKKLAGIVVEKK